MTTTICPQCHEAVHPSPGKGLPAYCAECSFPLVELAGKYKLLRELGEGGCSKVYLAEHLHLDFDRERVVKVLKAEVFTQPEVMTRRFRREVQVTSALSRQNEHIVKIYDDFGEDPKLGHFYVMEHLQGRPLADALQPGQGMDFRTAFKIFGELCQAMSAAHAAAIVHRDLKPDNIFLVERKSDPNFVKVIDFGIAKPLQHETKLQLTQGALGTPLYMSPEQCLNKEVGVATDIYAMGVILYEMLTGHNPFNIDLQSPGASALVLLHAHLTQTPLPPTQWRPDIPASIEQIMLETLAKTADDRPSSVELLWQLLCGAAPASWELQARFGTVLGARPPVMAPPTTEAAPEPPKAPEHDTDETLPPEPEASDDTFLESPSQAPTAPIDARTAHRSGPSAPTVQTAVPKALQPPTRPPLPTPHTPLPPSQPPTPLAPAPAEEKTNKRIIWLTSVGTLALLALLFLLVPKRKAPNTAVDARAKAGTLPPVKARSGAQKKKPFAPMQPGRRQPPQAALRVKRQQPPSQTKRPRPRPTRARPPRRRPRLRTKPRRRRSLCGSRRSHHWIYATMAHPQGTLPKVTFRGCPRCVQKRRRGGLCLGLPKGTSAVSVRVQIERYLACQHKLTTRRSRLRWHLKPLNNDILQEEWYPCLR